MKSTAQSTMGALLICLTVTACGEPEMHDTSTLSSALTKGQPGATIGDRDYCADPANLCDIGEGSCSRHSQCMTSLKCAPRGEIYGFPGLRVCVPAHCVNSRLETALGEIGVDCGGACGPCENAATCYDGMLDGSEEAIDCGGPDCDACADVVLTVNSPTEGNVYTTNLAPRVAGRVDTASLDQRGNRKVSFEIDGAPVGDTLTTSNGSWSFRLPARPPGVYTLSTTVENGAFSDTDEREYRVIFSGSNYTFGQLLSGEQSSSVAARAVAFGEEESIFTAGAVSVDLTYGGETITRAPSNGIVGYVSRAQSDGTPLWLQRFGSDEKTSISEIQTLSNGDVLAFGEFSGTIDLGSGPVTAAGFQDVFLVRLAGSTGQIIWGKALGADTSASIRKLAVTPQDDIVLTANYTGSVNFGGDISTSQGSTDMYVARLGPDGSLQWANSYGDAAPDTINDVDTDADGNIYLVGSFEGDLTVDTATISSPMNASAVLIKLTSSGKLISLQDIGGDTYDAAVRVGVAPDGDVVVSGVFAGEVDFGGGTFTATDDFDIFLVRYDSDGMHRWSQQIIAEPGAIFNSLEVSDTGNILIGGRTFAPIDLGGGLRTPIGRVDGFIGIYNSEGLLTSQRFLTSESELTPRGIAISPLNAYAIVGDMRGSLALLGGTPLTNQSRRSGFLALYR